MRCYALEFNVPIAYISLQPPIEAAQISGDLALLFWTSKLPLVVVLRKSLVSRES